MKQILKILFPRALIGIVVLFCAEVLSGAVLPDGLWHPWTILVTFWLYFAHFFFFTTLSVRTGRTSFTSLYLWGVLFGLYESWITKVIWYGYNGDGRLAMGSIGPYGFSEISMVFFFHPLMSFILPLTIACLLYPALRTLFPDLAWFTGRSKGARLVWFYFLISVVPMISMNSGGLINLAANLAVAILIFLFLLRFSPPSSITSDVRAIVVFGQFGFAGLCVYLVVLYGATYLFMRPDGLPSVPVQLFTFVFYVIAGIGLALHRRQEPIPKAPIKKEELCFVFILFAVLISLALVFTSLTGISALLSAIVGANFVIWTFGGFLLTFFCLLEGVKEHFSRPARPV